MTKNKFPQNHSCLSDETAACRVAGLLPVEAKEKIERHLASCASCRELVAVCSRVAKEQNSGMSPAPAALIKSAKALIGQRAGPNLMDVVVRISGHAFAAAETTGEILFAPWLPAVNPLRGRAADAVNVLVVEKVYKRFRVRVEVSGEKSGGYAAILTLCDARSGQAVPNIRVTLYEGEQELESDVTRDGHVSFERLTARRYRFEILGLEEKPEYLSLQLTGS
jgi:hypothetical protein